MVGRERGPDLVVRDDGAVPAEEVPAPEDCEQQAGPAEERRQAEHAEDQGRGRGLVAHEPTGGPLLV